MEAEADADRLADAILRADSPAGMTGAPAQPAAPDERAERLIVASTPRRSGGATLGHLRPPAEAVTNVDLGGVRVHEAPHLTRALGARAFARGADIYAGHDTTDRVMAHETAHVARQARTGRPLLQRWSDPTTTSLVAEDVETWSDADLVEGLELLVDQIAPVDRSVPEGPAEAQDDNLRLIVRTAVAHHTDLPGGLLSRIPPRYGPHTAQVVGVQARLDVLVAMLGREFPDRAPQLELRLVPHRELYPWLDADTLEEASADLAANVSAVETAARIHRVARDPGGDAQLTASINALDMAIANLLDALLTPNLAPTIAEVEAARDAWLSEMVGAFQRTATDARTRIATALDPEGYGHFSTGTDYSDPMRQEISALEQIRELVADGLARLAAEVPDDSQPLETRIDFVVTNSARLDDLLALTERVILGMALCDEGHALADLIYHEYQISEDNYEGLAHVSRALYDLIVTDYTAARMPQLRERVQSALTHADARLDAIHEYQVKVQWFINIAATLLGMGAMRAVMALPAVAALGRTGATIVGSLAFTTTRIVLTNNQGRPLTAGGFLEDAAKDYFLLRLLGGVDTRIVATVGETGALAAAARLGGTYGTLVAWTLTWNALQPGAPGPTGAHSTSTGDVFVQTGVDLGVLLIAEALLRAPVLPSSDLAVRGRDPNAARQAHQQWEALRRDLETTGGQLREWLRGTREDVAAGDGFLARAASLFAHAKELHGRFAEIGEIDDAQRAQLDANAEAMRESIRNARDELRLDVRSVTGETWSYRGSGENISAYLERLQTQGRVSEVTDEGNGVYSVRGSDGALQWFFPAGREAPVILDVVGESVEASAPEVPEAVRSQAIVHLRGAGGGDLGSFAGGLPRGTGGPFIRWVARPDVGAVLASNGLPMPVMRELSQATPEQLDPIVRADPRPLTEWYRAWRNAHPDSPPHDFVASLDDLAAWRGTLDVSGIFQATALLSRRAGAQAPTELELTPSPPSFRAAGTPVPHYSDVAARALRGDSVPGARYLERMRYDAHIVIEIVGGRVTRMFEIAADGTVTLRVPVATHMAALRTILFDVSATRDASAARTELARSDPILQALDPLLEFRDGVPVEQIHLMEALADHPLRRASPTTPTTPSAPGATGAPVPTRPPRRIVVTSGTPRAEPGPAIDLGRPPRLTRRPGESEGNFVDRVVGAEERAYQESINGPAGRSGENPARWARVQPTFTRLVAAMRNMQARLQRAGQGALLPQVNDGVLNQPVDHLVSQNGALLQLRLEIEARIRENAASEGRSVTESPEWLALQQFLGRTAGQAGARDTMGEMRPDIVEFMLDEGSIHISDVTTQALDPLSVHAFKTRVYVEILRQIVGPDGPMITGQDIQMRTDASGQRIDPARTRFGDIIE